MHATVFEIKHWFICNVFGKIELHPLLTRNTGTEIYRQHDISFVNNSDYSIIDFVLMAYWNSSIVFRI
jgi:hypothetical protein